MPKLRGILFDKDGTLFDFAGTWEAWALSFLTDLAGGDPARAAEFGRAIGFDTVSQTFMADSVAIAGTPSDVADALLPLFPKADHHALVERMNSVSVNVPMSEAVPLVPLLKGLKAQGFKLGVATNDAHEPAIAHLNAVNIVELFDFIAGFDSGYGAKPEPGMLNAFARQFDLQPSDVLMVGDSLHDLNAAQAAGMRPIGVLTGMAGAEDLAPFAEVVLPDIGHLPGWITENT